MWMQIKEAVAIVAGAGLIVYLPIRTRRVVSGWVPANFTGNAAEYPALYVKQATRFICVGVGIGLVFLALIPLADGSSDWVPDLVIAAIWLVIAAMTYHSRQQVSRLAV